MPVKSRLLALAAVSAVALVPAAQSADQPQTTAPPQVANIKITISDAGIRISPKLAQRGSMGRFILVNVGKKPHTFVLGTTQRGTGVQTGFVKSLKPSQQAVLLLFLDFRGLVPYHAPLPADRSKPAMRGTFRIV
jgi:opacity protein-like surface antigen